MSRTLHASRVEAECYFREGQYEARAWLPPQRVPFLRGTAVHGARERALRAYLAEKALPPVEELRDAAINAVATRVSEDEAKGIPTDDADETAALDEAIPIVEADLLLALPEIAPHVLAIEEELTVPVGDTGYTLSGRLDARGKNPVTGEGAIIDLKTGAPRDAQAAADLSSQLSFYAILHRHHFGSIPTFALDYVWTMAKGPKAATVERDGLMVAELSDGRFGVRRRVTTHRSADDLTAALRLLRFRIDSEEAGWHPPAYGGFMSPCSRCVHWGHEDPEQRCPFRPATRPAAVESADAV